MLSIRVGLISVCGALVACSGSDGSQVARNPVLDAPRVPVGAPRAPGAGPGGGWSPGSFLPSATFIGRCAAPRSGIDPTTGQPYIDVQGDAVAENNWLRSWSNELYLWYNEIVDRDPALYTTPDYFGLLKTTATTASGRAKDQFHFTYPTPEWLALVQSGIEAGYGAVWSVVASAPPRRIVVAYTHPGTPATAASVLRGEEVLTVDGADVVLGNTQAAVDTFVAGLFPDSIGETHTFTLRHPQTQAVRTVQLQSSAVTTTPVQNVGTIDTGSGIVGYMQFNDHIVTAEQQLVTAVQTLKNASIDDLVLDLRYNGGGLLAIASELAYMIAGTVPTAGQTFERLVFNNKHQTVDPVTGAPLTPLPFLTTASTGQPLPTLDLARVYVLTGGSTCSASESIINSLRGVNVEVIQIGSTTCGKPYGFYPADNCGTTYFSVQFKGVNAAGFGDYSDGFTPANTVTAGAERLPGCSVRDDFGHALGDPLEERFAAALAHRVSQTCPAPTGVSVSSLSSPAGWEPEDGFVVKSPFLMNRSLGSL
jgi:C-terminal processing protease CtpA/Prc